MSDLLLISKECAKSCTHLLNLEADTVTMNIATEYVRRERKQTTDLVPCIDIRECKRHPDLLPEDWILYDKWSSVSVFYRWKSDSDSFEILIEEIDRSSILNVEVNFTHCRFGGQRPWFSCPGNDCSHRRAAILYFHPLGLRCRKCSNLSYASQYEDKMFRRLRRANKLRLQLGGRQGLTNPMPEKPRYMHWATYERLYYEIIDIEIEAVYDFRDRAYARVGFLLERVGPHAAL